MLLEHFYTGAITFNTVSILVKQSLGNLTCMFGRNLLFTLIPLFSLAYIKECRTQLEKFLRKYVGSIIRNLICTIEDMGKERAKANSDT